MDRPNVTNRASSPMYSHRVNVLTHHKRCFKAVWARGSLGAALSNARPVAQVICFLEQNKEMFESRSKGKLRDP